jgi:tetratricopeptide (TPR) repeat protein
MIKATRDAKILALICVILVVTAVAFLPSLRNGFVNWDDDIYVTKNTIIQDLTLTNLKKIFSSFVNGNYHPLTTLTYSLEYRFFKLNPFVYHFTNLILHLINCLLVFWLIYMLTKKIAVSFLAAILFGIHPIHVESVAWISERKDVLYTLFFLAAAICYGYYLRKRQLKREGRLYYYFSLALFCLSLLSKAMAITLPLVLLLVDYWVCADEHRSVSVMLKEKIPFFILSFIFGGIAIWGQYSLGAVRAENSFNLLYKLMIPSYAITFYLYKILLPTKLSCLYPYFGITDNNSAIFLFSMLIVSILFIAIIISRKLTKNIIFGGMFFLITILPVLQFIPITSTIVADRYTYLPSIGVFYIIGVAIWWIYNKKLIHNAERIYFFVFLIIALGAVLFLTRSRCSVWENSIILWKDAIKNTSNNAMAYYNLGNAYDLINKKDEAVVAYKKSLEINPNDCDVYNNLAAVYTDKGEIEKAMELWNRALALNPNFVTAHFNLAVFYFQQKKFASAIKHCDKVIKLGGEVDPRFLRLLEPYRK